jgi:hypothetical protein
MQFDISRDFLDAMLLQQPPTPKDGKRDIRASGQLQFRPSSPDGTMHTAIVIFALLIGESEQPFAQGAWRFLFTSDAPFDPTKEPDNEFFGQLLMLGAGKIMAQLNNLCMHANLPLIPFEPGRMVLQRQPQGGTPAGVPAGAQPQAKQASGPQQPAK